MLYIGYALSSYTILVDFKKLYNKPTLANGIRFAYVGIVIGLGPEAGMADGVFDASGYKSKTFISIDQWDDKRISDSVLDSFKLP